MVEIKLHDKEIAHLNCLLGYDMPKYIKWYRGPEERDIAVFTERCLQEVLSSKAKIKIAMLLEPDVIHQMGYNKLLNGAFKRFDYILTHTMNFVDKIKELCGKAVWFPAGGGSWFYSKRWEIYPKTKGISIIASDKAWAPGHKLRHFVIRLMRDKIDFICGKGYKFVEDKMVAFKDFRYQIVIENSITPDYWTDKLCDCFATGTLPIFWGSSFLDKYFNMDGIVLFETVEHLQNILPMMDEKYYQGKLPAIKENYEIAKEYCVPEDWLYNNFLKEIM